MQLNELAAQFGPEKLAIVCFPCNQFGHQENGRGPEILASLKHLRPGGGYVPDPAVIIHTDRCDVNGSNAHGVWRFLRHSLPFPEDRDFDEEADAPNGILGKGGLGILWKPLSRTDVTWNFAKFLVDARGVPRRRFSPCFETAGLGDFIAELIKEGEGSEGDGNGDGVEGKVE